MSSMMSRACLAAVPDTSISGQRVVRELKELFTSLAYAGEKIAIRVDDYNTGRPHSSLGYATPAAFAADLEKQPLASPAHMANNDAEAPIATG